MDAFLYGFFLALGLIVPLGVQNIFIFNQGANQRHFLHAMPSVITATVCDSILILAAVLGVSVAVIAIPWLKTALFLVGFCFLMSMGWITWRAKPMHLQEGRQPCSTKRQILFAASVSIFNPHALLDTIGVIGTNSLHFLGQKRWLFVAGCIFISACWFFSLSVAGHFMHKLDKSGFWLRAMNKISALIIWTVAVYVGWKLFCQLQ